MSSCHPLLMLAATIGGNFLIEGAACPRGSRTVYPALMLGAVLSTLVFGFFLALCGSTVCAWLLSMALVASVVCGSNIKLSVLDEPLVFSDLFVLKNFLNHPRFYIFAVPGPVRVVVVLATVLVLTALGLAVWRAPLARHGWGVGIMLPALVALAALPAGRLAPGPDLARDISRLGLTGCLFVYWRRWRQQPVAPRPPAPALPAQLPELVVVVQCESFADPATLGLPPDIPVPPLPGLARARAMASQYGMLEVSGFGAYTNRTEYGVLFGRNAQELGFRQFDPFLTADTESKAALPYLFRQAGFETVYIHPYDLSFYNRNTMMREIGFEHLQGRDAFAYTPTATAPYVPDSDLAHRILDTLHASRKPLFLYAVSIENHGPWHDDTHPVHHYLHHLAHTDAMIDQLVTGLERSGRTARLVFFGDHRPSIPGMTSAGAGRSTPYAVLDFPPVPMEQAQKNISARQIHDIITSPCASERSSLRAKARAAR
ncbi:LTA synthase family protein [Acetobacter sp. TBRC 12305]|uniref:LTA synthase family protein n=1 Tax=Acetobacter garciniae TaxID=2817435 RepID=A0A939KM07_9PROT|nr:LTA synthase family protein [Acetobacter garciniae]MBO1324788.1 LTA synthase family protein [Acetobacter garciniae]MBX0344479.1 LTA synthase family protein [Acetobacter garciniae]